MGLKKECKKSMLLKAPRYLTLTINKKSSHSQIKREKQELYVHTWRKLDPCSYLEKKIWEKYNLGF
jgi:hypothetical protein